MSIVEKDIMSRVKKQNDFNVGQDIGVYTMQRGKVLTDHILREKEEQKEKEDTYRIYMITPKDQISHDLSYFSGPRTSGAGKGDGKYDKSIFGG